MESDAAYVDFFVRSLKAACSNFELRTFTNDADLIGFFKSDHLLPDFVFLDPNPGGIDCLKFIKSLYPSNNFHVIMCGGDAPEQHANVCYRLGATAYMQKTNEQKLMTQMMDFCINALKNSPIQEDFVLNKRFERRANK
jgi:DNA-binding NarL/FixJ family response regulator